MTMASSTLIATALSPTRETLSSSQLLTSSISSLTSSTSRQTSSQISKIYRQASTLFLTRRLPESLSTILPVINPAANDEDTVTDTREESAPIAKASRTTRIKVWSLYLTILNAVLELDPEEGKQAFGSSEYRSLISKVREGEVWEEVVMNGYHGVEGDVDSDVVINLATLLLAHARTQKTNQTRLENYLASSTSPPPQDISARLQSPNHTPRGARSPTKPTSGTDTPRDLTARVKILELYTLHVLLRNNEWEYAREFISISSVLDEERREAFLQALQSLQDETREVEGREREERRYREDVEEQRQRRERETEERRREEEREREKAASVGTPSEVDYGVEDNHPPPRPGSSRSQPRSLNGDSVKANGQLKKQITSPTIRSSKSIKKTSPPPPSLVNRAGAVITNLRKLLESMASSFGKNPMVLLRMLAFLVGLLMVLARGDVRERIKRGWAKVLQTAGMGVKVSYI